MASSNQATARKSRRRSKAAGKADRPDCRAAWSRVARPDAHDPRDRAYTPNVAACPSLTLFPKLGLAVKNQGSTNACTGFALSLVVEHLLRASGREKAAAISPY